MREIKPTHNHGSLTIRFTYQGKRYQLSGFGQASDKASKAKADQVAKQIYLDCLTGSFDLTLNRYRPANMKKQSSPGILLDHLEARLSHRIGSQYNPADVALMGNLIQYRDPIASQEQAQAFVEWLRDTKKLAASSIKRYLNSCRDL